MSTTITSPNTFAQDSGSGLTPTFLGSSKLERAIMDALAVDQDLGEPTLDFAGLGVDTARLGVVDDVGWSLGFAATGGETTAPTPSPHTLDYSSLSIAERELAFTESIKAAILGRGGVYQSTDILRSYIPESLQKTLRSLFMTVGSGFTYTSVGDDALTLSADDAYDLAAAIALRLGIAGRGRFTAYLDPAQRNAWRTSFRSEPAYVQNMQGFLGIQAVAGQRETDPLGLGFDIALSDDVVQSGGAYRAFCCNGPWRDSDGNFHSGAIVWGKASTSRARLPAGVTPMYLDAWGLVLYDLMTTIDAKKKGFQALWYGGLAAKSTRVSHQIRIKSLV